MTWTYRRSTAAGRLQGLLWILVALAGLALTGGTAPAEAQTARNPGLLNVRDVQPTSRVVLHGASDTTAFDLTRDTLQQWLEAAVDTSDFGRAELATSRSDSMAYLDVNLQVVGRSDTTYLATAIFQVLRPGYVINIPAEEALYDVPVMQTAFTLEGTETRLHNQMQDLIGQYVRFTARRIREHNPASDRPFTPADTAGRPRPVATEPPPSDTIETPSPDTSTGR